MVWQAISDRTAVAWLEERNGEVTVTSGPHGIVQ